MQAQTMADRQNDFDIPEAIAVAHLPGSLPMGGVVPDTPIHAFVRTPRALVFSATPRLSPTCTELDVAGPTAFVIRNVVTADEADAIIKLTEHLGYRDEAPGINTPPGMRMNKTVHWLADDAMLGAIFTRIGALLPPTLDGRALHPQLSHRINMYRYDANDVFNRHIDGAWPAYSLNADRTRMQQWAGVSSMLTMILYLNGVEDGVIGGNTRLFARDGRVIDVTPKKGDALFFRHGFGLDSVQHEGARVTSAVAKYVARINVMYADPTAT